MIARVAVENTTYAFDREFSYLVPSHMQQELSPGCRVLVPFGRANRSRQGLVLELEQEMPERQEDQSRLKALCRQLDETPLLDEEQLWLVKWLHKRVFCTYYEALRAVVPGGLTFRVRMLCAKGPEEDFPQAPSDGQQRIWEYLCAHKKPVELDQLLEELKMNGRNPDLQQLVQCGALLMMEDVKEKSADSREIMVRLNEERVEKMQEQGIRLTAVRLLRAMRDEESCFAGRSEWCTDLEAVRHAVEALPHTMLKAPWSGSGRGLRQGFGRLDEALAGWVRRVLSRQGGLSVEPFLTKRCDLALEFEAHPGGQWDYVGPSVFVTDATGRYAGSLVAPDDVLLRAIDRQVDLRLVDEARRLVEQLLPRLAEGYTGPVGVDMMVVEGKRGEAALHPCVEVNLRRTMGRVALDLRRHLAAGLTARFVLARPRIGTPAPMWHGDRLVGGSLPLVPVGATTSVAAYLDVADGSRDNWSAMM